MKTKNETAYDQWAATYDTNLNSTLAADDVAFPELWKTLTGKRVLEIGSGTGRHTERLLNQRNDVVGIDLSAGMLEIARQRLQGQCLAGRSVRLVHGDVHTFTTEVRFEAALSALVLEHIEDLQGFFSAVSRLLVPGAPFFISEIHPSRAKAGRLAHFKDPQSGSEIWLDSVAHSQAFVEECARASGFDVIRSEDALGTEALLRKNSEWKKYVGIPMVKIWELRSLRPKL